MWPIQNEAKNLKMTETLANGYSSESTQRELSSEYQQLATRQGLDGFQKYLHPWTKV